MSSNISSSAKINMEEEILRPHTYITQLQSHGTFITGVVDMLQYWLKIPDDKAEHIKSLMNMFIHFTCLFDDIQDNSIYRRHIPCAHRVYGVPLTVNTIMHTKGLIIEKVIDLNHPEAIKIYVKYYLLMMRGNGEDIFRRENQIPPNEEDYIRMAEGKCSHVFMMVSDLMQLFSDNKTDYTKFNMDFGVYYIIRDDYCNLMKPESYEGQTRINDFKNINDVNFCEDMTDGKFTFPVMHAVQFSEARPLFYMMRLHSRDMGIKMQYRSLLERLGSIEYTRATLDKYDSELRKELFRLGGNPVVERILNDFRDWRKN